MACHRVKIFSLKLKGGFAEEMALGGLQPWFLSQESMSAIVCCLCCRIMQIWPPGRNDRPNKNSKQRPQAQHPLSPPQLSTSASPGMSSLLCRVYPFPLSFSLALSRSLRLCVFDGLGRPSHCFARLIFHFSLGTNGPYRPGDWVFVSRSDWSLWSCGFPEFRVEM